MPKFLQVDRNDFVCDAVHLEQLTISKDMQDDGAAGSETKLKINPDASGSEIFFFRPAFDSHSVDRMDDGFDVIWNCHVFFDSCRRDSLVTGTAEVSSDGVLMLAIPYENGWHAYVDGKETEIHRVNYSFTGISLTRGSHEIRLEYRCPGFAAGVIGSAASLLLTAGIWGAYFLKRKRSHPS